MRNPATTCSRCPFACDKPRRGPCACKVDGLDVLVHIERRECPKGFYDGTPAETPPPAPPPPVAVPREEWPFAANVLARLAVPTDRGLGDTLARVVDPLGGDAYKRWYFRITGVECGCANRQEKLNARYPLY